MRAFHPEKVPLPPDFRPLPVRAELPLDIEIGCGVGYHPLHYARNHPGRQLVAFERTSEKFEKFAARIANHPPLANLIAIHGDALPWITHGVKPRTVDRYFILYPNPYPKEKQRNQRFYAMPFLPFLLGTLKPGGTLTLATNESFFAEEAKSALTELRMELVEDRALSPTVQPRSHFEKKYLARGDVCRNLVFRRPK